MKTLIVSIAVMLSAVSSANAAEGVVEFLVEKAQYNDNHIQNPGEGRIFVDYANNKALLQVEREFFCPASEICPQVMPEPLRVELPITTVEVDTCGIKKITALVDMRPADGSKQELVIEDASSVTCQFLIPVESKAAYETSHYDRLNGKEVVNVSKMQLHRVSAEDPNVELFHLGEGAFLKGFSDYEKPTAGTLIITDKEVLMKLKIAVKCAPNMMCPKFMPRPVTVRLPITKVQHGGCANVIEAKLVNSEEGTTEELQIMDYRNTVCKIHWPHPLRVDYKMKLQDNETVLAEKEATLFFGKNIKRNK